MQEKAAQVAGKRPRKSGVRKGTEKEVRCSTKGPQYHRVLRVLGRERERERERERTEAAQKHKGNIWVHSSATAVQKRSVVFAVVLEGQDSAVSTTTCAAMHYKGLQAL